MMRKRFFPRPAFTAASALLLCALFLLWGLTLPRPAKAAAEKEMTLMVYMAGSDLETQNGAASADIREMLDAGCDFSRVNLIILAGGAERWHLGFSSEELSVIQLGARGMRVAQRLPLANMGEPETLTSFLNYAKEAFPAREYALIFWNHGGGPMEGVCYDELFGRDRLSLSELETALAKSPFSAENPLNWIGFDACLMASVETAGVCADYARCMIASQETEPFTGWNYAFLSEAADTKEAADLGRAIVDAYMAAAPDNPTLTLSCVSLARLGSVKAAMSDFFLSLRDGLNAETFSTLSNLRRDTRSFGKTTTLSDYDLADLYHLCEQYADQAPEEAAVLKQALEAAVVYNSSHQENAHGLSVYSPYYNKESYSERWLSASRQLGFDSSYASWLTRYSTFWLGDQLADWSGLTGRALPVGEDGVQTLELSLTEEQEKHFADARVVILRDQGYGDAYFKVFEIADLRPDSGLLRADYDFSGLFAVDENGHVVSDIYPFTSIQDGLIQVGASLETTSYFQRQVQIARNELTADTYGVQPVTLVCARDPETDSLEIRDVIAQPDDPMELTTGKQYISLDASDYPYVYFSDSQYAYTLTYDRDSGNPLPYTQWPSGSIPSADASVIDPEGTVWPYSEWNRNYHEQTVDGQSWRFFGEVDNTRPWSLRFLKGQYSPQRLYAQFIVTDTQGVETATELIPLHYPALADAQSFSRELYRDSQFSVTLEGIDVVKAASGSGLYLRFLIENHSDLILAYAPDILMLNETMIDTSNLLYSDVRPGETVRAAFPIPAEDIPYLDDMLTGVTLSLSLQTKKTAADAASAYAGAGWADAVRLETALDLSALGIPRPGSAIVWAETRSPDLSVRLLDLEEKKDGSLRGVFHLVPLGGEILPVRFFVTEEDPLDDVIVNGCYFRDALHASDAWQLWLSPGCDMYVPFTMSRITQLDLVGGSYTSLENPFPSEDGFA